jgi:hypothetical protein
MPVPSGTHPPGYFLTGILNSPWKLISLKFLTTSCISLEWELTAMPAAQSWFPSLGEHAPEGAATCWCGALIWLASRLYKIRKMRTIWHHLFGYR